VLPKSTLKRSLEANLEKLREELTESEGHGKLYLIEMEGLLLNLQS